MSELNKPLKAAVRYLYGQGIIQKDKDISDRTGYNKTSVSSYLTGNVKASSRFLKSFEKAFKLDLAKFVDGSPQEVIVADDPLQLLSERVLRLYAVARVNQSLLVEILASQTGKTVMELNRAVSSAMDEEIRGILRELKQEPK